ncbi:MAG: 50S ribosomal protein L4 [Pseudomonadota bacterium]|nr:50S ribosomal protein L4 [Rhodospirillaceae bacterium]MEC7806675.1 50S ribosomal protein L4 [Pseudomonadota bacterium]MEC7972700.1 50S ribosomal protein L4 [Pseudomonadota bacterium]MED5472698.1 50S ribosomal protein L4 [Pseudomonadota bacterium]|tara:strand:- start:993 stop:1610 length:618 start_codon:yes stop_codon:yes gene_type:complete
MKCQVKDFNNKAKGQIELNDSVFGIEPRKDILARTVNWQLAKRRSGTHKVKLVGDIRGTTAKPFRQKGTGRARQGSSRATQFRGGATVHGPVVRSHGYKLPKKIRKLALKCALSSKQVDGKLLVLDNFEVSGKTKDLVETIKKFGFKSVLFIDGPNQNTTFAQASSNIPKCDFLPSAGANVYDILRRDYLVLSREAVQHLEERLG